MRIRREVIWKNRWGRSNVGLDTLLMVVAPFFIKQSGVLDCNTAQQHLPSTQLDLRIFFQKKNQDFSSVEFLKIQYVKEKKKNLKTIIFYKLFSIFFERKKNLRVKIYTFKNVNSIFLLSIEFLGRINFNFTFKKSVKFTFFFVINRK